MIEHDADERALGCRFARREVSTELLAQPLDLADQLVEAPRAHAVRERRVARRAPSSHDLRPDDRNEKSPLAGALLVAMVAGVGFEPTTFGL